MIYGNREKWPSTRRSWAGCSRCAAGARNRARTAARTRWTRECGRLLAGGVSIAQQALAAGLVDEVRLHVAPVVVGRGVSLFGASRAGLRCVEAVQGEGAVHLRYDVR